MAVKVIHAKVATVPDDPNYEVGSSEWNEEHVVEGCQENLVSGVNIRSINGESILESGDLLLEVAGTAEELLALEVTARNAAIAQAIIDLVGLAPDLLNDLNELAAAIGDDPNFAVTMATALGTKVNAADLGSAAYTAASAYASSAQGAIAEEALPKTAQYFTQQASSFTLSTGMVGKHVPVALTVDSVVTLPDYTGFTVGSQILVQNQSATAKKLTMSGSVTSPKGTIITQGNSARFERQSTGWFAFGGIST